MTEYFTIRMKCMKMYELFILEHIHVSFKLTKYKLNKIKQKYHLQS